MVIGVISGSAAVILQIADGFATLDSGSSVLAVILFAVAMGIYSMGVA